MLNDGAFPFSPNCIIHQLQNSGKYVLYKDIKALMSDLKRVYQAVDEQSALVALDDFVAIWEKKTRKSRNHGGKTGQISARISSSWMGLGG